MGNTPSSGKMRKRQTAGFEKFSKKDANRYLDYLEFWKGVSELLGPLMLSTPPSLEDFVSVFQTPESLEGLKVPDVRQRF